MRLKVRAGAQGGALTPKKTLELAWTVPQEQGCTPVHYRAVSDAQNRSLNQITSGECNAQNGPVNVSARVLQAIGSPQEGGR